MNPRPHTAQPERSEAKSKANPPTLRLRRYRGYAQSERESNQGCTQVKTALSEVMTIEVAFHQSDYRTFKDFYRRYVSLHPRWAFPRLVSYNRFVELMQHALSPLCASLQTRKGHSQRTLLIPY